MVEGACFKAGFSAGLVFDAELWFVVLDEACVDSVFELEVFTRFGDEDVEYASFDGGQAPVFVEGPVFLVCFLGASKKGEPHAAAAAGPAVIVW